MSMSGAEPGLGARARRARRRACRPWPAAAGSGPAIASLVIGGSASWPSSSRLACRCSIRSRPASAGARARRRRGSPAPARPARPRPPPPGRCGAGWRRRSWPAGSRWPAPPGAPAAPPRPARCRARPSRVSSALIASPSLTTTRSTPRTSRALAWIFSRRAAPTRASAASGPGTGDLQRHRAARLGQRAVGEERAAPGRFAVAAAAGDHLPGQPAHRPPVAVHQAGLPGQAVAVLGHPDHVPVALPQPARGEHDQLGGVPEHLGDVLAQPARGRAGVQLGLDHDVPAGQVQPAGEPAAGRTPPPCGSTA